VGFDIDHPFWVIEEFPFRSHIFLRPPSMIIRIYTYLNIWVNKKGTLRKLLSLLSTLDPSFEPSSSNLTENQGELLQLIPEPVVL